MNKRPLSAAEDEHWMGVALDQSRRGIGLTSPNPPVGAAIVQWLGSESCGSWQLIGASYHECAGEAHAERRAIQAAREAGYESEQLIGACIYITLEPCSSWGRTPPCTDAILEAGITRVVYACPDPDIRHQGRARRILEEQGVVVIEGLLRTHSERILRPWFYAIKNKKPWVVAKVATSLDGRLSRSKTPWLSGKESLSYAHQLRAESDAIMVGGETLRRDNPSLSIRTPISPLHPRKKQPWRILVTQRELTEKDKQGLALFHDEHAERTLTYEKVENWDEFLSQLYEHYGIVQLMLETGGQLLKPLLQGGHIQEWVQIVTPHIAGGPHQLIAGADYMDAEPQFTDISWTDAGQDRIFRALID